MSLNKRLYTAGQTTITSQNLNDIQDSIIELENKEVQQGVTSFNGQTGDVELDALLFTKQDLLADQKKQVKENLEIPDFFIINLSSDSDGSLTIDKTFDEIMSNIKADNAVFILSDGSMFPLTSYSNSTITFLADTEEYKILLNISSTGDITTNVIFNVVADENANIPNIYKMASDPTEDMCIATKHYVDSHAGGSGSCIITLSGKGIDSSPYTLDKTFDEIVDMAATGVVPIVSGMDFVFHLITIDSDSIVFGAMYVGLLSFLIVSKDNSINLATRNISMANDSGTFPQIEMSADPTKDMQVATKQYVDNHSGTGAAPLTVITITGDGTEENPYTASKSYSEIKNLWSSGNLVVFVDNMLFIPTIFSNEKFFFNFNNAIYGQLLSIDKTNNISTTIYYYFTEKSIVRITGDGTEENPYESSVSYDILKASAKTLYPLLEFNGDIFTLCSSNNRIVYIRDEGNAISYSFSIGKDQSKTTVEYNVGMLKLSSFENDAGYLTSHQSLSEYSKTTEVEALIDQKISALPKIYSGTVTPESSLGNDGDIYIQKGVAE